MADNNLTNNDTNRDNTTRDNVAVDMTPMAAFDNGPEDPIIYEEKGSCKCCFGPVINMPWGWPKGSCTSLFTLIAIIFCVCGIVVVQVYAFVTYNTILMTAMMGLYSNIFSYAFGHYTGARTSDTSLNKVAYRRKKRSKRK